MTNSDLYHILNGDALLEIFPVEISGEKIVFRECLIDGPVCQTESESFYEVRESFLKEAFGEGPDYELDIVPELQKISNIPSSSEVHLWFEGDLFCQINLWYTIHQLQGHQGEIYIVHPPSHTPYGFGGLKKDELLTCLQNKMRINHFTELKKLWSLYQEGQHEVIVEVISQQDSNLAFMIGAAQANVDRFPMGSAESRPIKTLIEIMKELGADDFDPVFREFCLREPIYGYGDLQVRIMFDHIIKTEPDS